MPDLNDLDLNVVKDPIDLRDLYYEGSLLELPRWIDNRGRVPLVLDQGQEGACTGFGLAAVANFLLHNRAGARQLRSNDGASARMLYEMAKRYDEWPGRDYAGSSIRGAMKGWHKHGVCREATWPYRTSQAGRLTARRQTDAVDRPLGNYFRVRHLHLSHMHSAIAEAGILYASADVHAGWSNPNRTTGKIRYRGEKTGGHAFAIVGYDEEGFWIQNSWGRDWGVQGFAHLSYDDWLEHGFDCWVARLGVVTYSRANEDVSAREGSASGRVQTFDYLPHAAAVSAAIRPHLVNLGNDGELSDSGRYQTDEQDIEEIFKVSIPEQTRDWAGPKRILLYAHGGLNDEKKSAARIASMRPYFLANEIYPIHFMWETGIGESIGHIVRDAFSHRRFGGLWSSFKDRLLDLADDGIELAIGRIGRALWREMKENAEGASEDRHGADVLAKHLRQFQLDGNDIELHLVGHSAGTILLSHMIPALALWELDVKSLTFYAPACTTGLFRDNVIPHLGGGRTVDRATVFNLNGAAERDDDVINVYNKSLLYLVSGAFEERRDEPILGLERDLEKDSAVVNALGGVVRKTGPAVIRSSRGGAVRLRSNSDSHGGFDNDAHTLNSTLRIVKGRNQIAKPFPD